MLQNSGQAYTGIALKPGDEIFLSVGRNPDPAVRPRIHS
jgi:hypothetical protein